MRKVMFGLISVAVIATIISLASAWGLFLSEMASLRGPAYSNDIFQHWMHIPAEDTPGKMVFMPKKGISPLRRTELDIKRNADREIIVTHFDEVMLGTWRVHDKDHLEVTLDNGDTWLVKVISVNKDRLIFGHFWITPDDEGPGS